MIIFSLWAFFQSSASIFPSKVSSIGTYSDSQNNGKSKVTAFTQQDDRLVMEYNLAQTKQIEYPFAGIFIDIFNSPPFFDASGFDFLKIRMGASSGTDMKVYLLTFAPGFTRLIITDHLRFLQTAFPVTNNIEEYRIPISQFATPAWWFEQKKVSQSSLGEESFTQVVRLQVESGLLLKPGVTDKITIESISFEKDQTLLYLITGIVLLLYVTTLLTGFLVRGDKKPIITYKPLEVKNPANEETRRIIDYLASSYSNPDLSIEMIAQATGILSSRISTLLKEHNSYSFKQVLNSIRLTEAKRLLSETDIQIIEVAYNVGYNTVSHFNRLFKQVENISPKEYRRKYKK